MWRVALAFWLLPVASALAAEAQPPAFIRLKVNGAVHESGARIPGRPGERLSLEAKVYGARRAWCMDPQRYANMGRNTVIEAHGEDGLSFTTGPGFRGVWRLQSESATWWGQLTGETRATAGKNDAVLTVPEKPGNYLLQVKGSATWHYDRHSQGNHVEQVEKNDAEGNFTVVVEQASGVWFSSANIVAQGTPDDDVRFRLQTLQQRYDTISQQLLDGKFELARSGLEGVQETLATIRSRLDQLKKDKPGFDCKVTFIGLPTDKAMKRLDALKKMAGQWRVMHGIVNGNAQQINTMLLNTQMVFSNNVLKSVFKNYLDWGSGIPGTGDFFGAVPFNLAVLTVPGNVLDWYGNAQEDASILKDQAMAIRRMGELRAFYEKRGREFIEENKKIHAEMDKAKPVEALAAQARGMLSSTGWASWKPGAG
ncbi:MAG: hypothetical protein ACYC8T_00035 [Myxococcaceae bacterium]